MPNLDDKTRVGIQEGWTESFPANPTMNVPMYPTPTPTDPGYAVNPALRCSFPGGTTTDAVRQFYRPGVYTRRLFPAQQGVA